MNMRDMSDQVMARFERGESRQDVFRALLSSNPGHDGKIAYCIASTPDLQSRNHYLKLNGLLGLLLIAWACLTLADEWPIDFAQPTLFIVFRTLLPLVFFYFVYRFHGGVYRVVGLWAALDLLEGVLLTGAPNGIAALRLLVIFFSGALAFHLARKVFPHLGLLGPKRDADGNYLL